MEIGRKEDSATGSVALDKGRDKGGDNKGVDETEKGKIDSSNTTSLEIEILLI